MRFEFPEFHRFVFESPAAEITGRLMRARAALEYGDAIFVKKPGSEARTPWHHDVSYYPFAGGKECAL